MNKLVDSWSRAFSRAPVLGAVFIGVVIMGALAISARSVFAFFSFEGLIIVVGGVIAVAFMSYNAKDVQKALQAVGAVFREAPAPQDNLRRDMANIIAWAILIKEKGLRDFEAIVGRNGIDDPFIKYGLNMVVSEYAPDDVRAMMETAADAYYERDCVPIDVLHAMASHGPAFGMIGTLVGMVTLLGHLTDDVSGIGASLAVAFLSTLYGVVSARMAYMPAAARLQQEVDSRRFRNQLVTEGMVMLVANKTPMYIQDRLNSFLRPETHNYFDYFKSSPKRASGVASGVVPRMKPPISSASPSAGLLKVVNA